MSYDTMRSISAVCLILFAVCAVSAVFVYIRFELKEYRQLVKNLRSFTPATQALKERKPSENTRATKEEIPRKVTVKGTKRAEQEENGKEAKKKEGHRTSSAFSVRTVSESDAIRRKKQEEQRLLQEDTSARVCDDDDGSSQTENLEEEKVGQGIFPDEEKTGNAAEEEMDGLTSLQDGSDDTTYLRKKDREEADTGEDDSELWIQPSQKIRPMGGTIIIHTDRTVRQILGSA